MVSQNVNGALCTNTFTAEASHAHLILCNLTFDLIFNRFETVAVSSSFAQKSYLECMASALSLQP